MLRHRLNSIYYDKLELDRLFEKFPQIPVVANLRCGSWYCDADKNHACYFKSTDGHDKQWDFNIRRLNSHFLEFIYKHNTVFVVDSTGNSAKVYPDALSKTIPIWATVMNRLFCADGADGVILPDVISERESRELRETVERKINDWVELAKSVLPEHLLEFTRQKHNKPKKIIPIFVSSRDSFDSSVLMDDSTIKIICVSAGSSNSSHTDDTYILGAGDDEEMWSHGLTAEMFWNQPEKFLKCATDTELEAYIREMLHSTHGSCIQNEVMNDPIYGKISVSMTTAKDMHETNEILIACDDTRTITLNYDMKIKNVVYDLMCCLHKLYITSRATIHISGSNPDINIAICCAIAIFNYRYNTTGNVITKSFIRNIICRICAAADDFKLFPRRYCRELNTFFISREMY